jgi:predicted O-linked N-acetylglucosamine transferase (SPINDLY family)
MTELSVQQSLELALTHQKAGRMRDAELLYRAILTRDPNHADALNLLGVLAQQVGRSDAAVELIRKALKIKPRSATYHVNLGVALAGANQMDAAMGAFKLALQMDPKNLFALGNLGDIYLRRGEHDLAIDVARQALAIDPDYRTALNVLGIVLHRKFDIPGAMAAFQRVVELRPESFQSHNNLGNVQKEAGLMDEAIVSYRRAAGCMPPTAMAHSNLLYSMHSHIGSTDDEILEEHQKWNTVHARPLAASSRAHTNDRNPDRRLRVGYVSPDFREHSVANFIQGLLAAHDVREVEVFCYANLPRPDATSEKLQKLGGKWQNIAELSDDRTADLMRRDQIDILVDLAGHTGGHRLLVFARKPAPIQITYLGYPHNTCLETMDYRLTDAHADPPGIEPPGEALLRLPGTFLCYTAPADAPGPAPSPSVRNGFITFGSFNLLSKINLPLVKMWAGILRQVPGSHMLIKTGMLGDSGARKRMADLFAAEGIEPQRLDFRGYSPTRREHLQMYANVDIALDTFPYNGVTTTCEALWMGVPVITLAGQTHVSRVGVSLLSNVGLARLIANSPEDYVRVAVELAGDRAALSEWRSGLRSTMKASPLMDARTFARNIESIYRQVWRKWCGQA